MMSEILCVDSPLASHRLPKDIRRILLFDKSDKIGTLKLQHTNKNVGIVLNKRETLSAFEIQPWGS